MPLPQGTDQRGCVKGTFLPRGNLFSVEAPHSISLAQSSSSYLADRETQAWGGLALRGS